MASPVQSPTMKTLPNFRCLNVSSIKGSSHTNNAIFRSSRPDLLDGNDLETFKTFGIRTIIDLRSKSEYMVASGPKLLDDTYKPYSVDLPQKRNPKPKSELYCYAVPKTKDVKHGRGTCVIEQGMPVEKKRFLINFFNLNYVKRIFTRAPWYIQVVSLILLLLETIFRTRYLYFTRLFALTVVNKAGLGKSYEDMVELSQSSIYAGTKMHWI